jgi:hypothetical protein
MKKSLSALGIGLAFAAVLALTVLPGFVAAAGQRTVQYGTGDWNWNIYAKVDVSWDDSYNILTTQSSVSHGATGGLGVSCSINAHQEYLSSVIADSSIEAKFTPTLGNSWTIFAEAWCSPGQPAPYGGSWRYV